MLFINCIPLYIFLTLFSDLLICGSAERRWIGENAHRTLIIDEGDEIELTCYTEKPITFIFPKHNGSVAMIERITSNYKSSEKKNDTGFMETIFRRPKAVYGDTGFYGCIEVTNDRSFDYDVDYLDSDYLPKPLNLTYFYVRSNKSAFTDEPSSPGYKMTGSNSLLIPCKPTSPDIHIELEHHYRGNRSVITSDERVQWEPKLGFKITNSTLIRNYGQYICKANHSRTQEMVYFIFVQDYVEDNTPAIYLMSTNPEWVRYVEKGTTMKLSCSARLKNITNHELKWIIPQPYERIKTELNIEENESYGYWMVRSMLTINNVTEEDERNYRCDVIKLDNDTSVSEPKVRSAERYIKIYNPSMRFISLFSAREERNFIRQIGESLIIFVGVEGYPLPKMEWLNPKGENIHINNTAMNEETRRTAHFQTWMYAEDFQIIWHHFLSIRKVELNDAGVYTFRVSHEEETKTMNFTLEVKP